MKLIFPLSILLMFQIFLIIFINFIAKKYYALANNLTLQTSLDIPREKNQMILFFKNDVFIYSLILLNIIIFFLVYKNYFQKHKQAKQIHLKYHTLINALHKFISHDVRKPLNLVKLLNNSIETNKPNSIIKNIASEITKSADKIEMQSESILFYSNQLRINTEQTTLSKLTNLLQNNLEHVAIFMPNGWNQGENLTVELNVEYFLRAMKSLINLLKLNSHKHEIALNFIKNKHNNFKIELTYNVITQFSQTDAADILKSILNNFEYQVIENILNQSNCTIFSKPYEFPLKFTILLPKPSDAKEKKYA